MVAIPPPLAGVVALFRTFLLPIAGNYAAIHIQSIIVKLQLLKEPAVQFYEYRMIERWGEFFKELP